MPSKTYVILMSARRARLEGRTTYMPNSKLRHHRPPAIAPFPEGLRPRADAAGSEVPRVGLGFCPQSSWALADEIGSGASPQGLGDPKPLRSGASNWPISSFAG